MKFLLEEVQQEYDSKFTLIFVSSICVFFYLNFLLPCTIYLSSFPFPNLSPGEKLHDLVALTQHDPAKLQPIEKLGWDYLHEIQIKNELMEGGVSKIQQDQAQKALAGTNTAQVADLLEGTFGVDLPKRDDDKEEEVESVRSKEEEHLPMMGTTTHMAVQSTDVVKFTKPPDSSSITTLKQPAPKIKGQSKQCEDEGLEANL